MEIATSQLLKTRNKKLSPIEKQMTYEKNGPTKVLTSKPRNTSYNPCTIILFVNIRRSARSIVRTLGANFNFLHRFLRADKNSLFIMKEKNV